MLDKRLEAYIVKGRDSLKRKPEKLDFRDTPSKPKPEKNANDNP